MVPCSLMATLSELKDKGDNPLVENLPPECQQQPSAEDLAEDQKQVYHKLGPLYKKIYLYALDSEERHRVIVYIKRGISPYEAINIILRPEERAYAQKRGSKNIPPSDRHTISPSPSISVY